MVAANRSWGPKQQS